MWFLIYDNSLDRLLLLSDAVINLAQCHMTILLSDGSSGYCHNTGTMWVLSKMRWKSQERNGRGFGGGAAADEY